MGVNEALLVYQLLHLHEVLVLWEVPEGVVALYRRVPIGPPRAPGAAGRDHPSPSDGDVTWWGTRRWPDGGRDRDGPSRTLVASASTFPVAALFFLSATVIAPLSRYGHRLSINLLFPLKDSLKRFCLIAVEKNIFIYSYSSTCSNAWSGWLG